MALPRRRDRAAREAPSGTRSSWSLIALGIVAARLWSPRFRRVRWPAAAQGVTAIAFTGSIGPVASRSWRGAVLGDLRWRVAPLSCSADGSAHLS
jgi:hypothetical protein